MSHLSVRERHDAAPGEKVRQSVRGPDYRRISPTECRKAPRRKRGELGVEALQVPGKRDSHDERRRGARQGGRGLDTVASLTREPEKARSLVREPRHGGAIGCKCAQTRPAGLETRNPESGPR